MVSVLASSAVDHGFKPRSGHTKHYKIGISCFSAKEKEQKLVGSESEKCVRDSEWSYMSTHRLLFQ